MVFAGSWDRSVWSWDLDSKIPGRQFIGHADFVKAVVCARLAGKYMLISGGADKKIIVWDVETGARVHTLQDSTVNMLAVQDLVIDPVRTTEDEVFLVSASSDPHIRQWKIRADSWEQLSGDVSQTEQGTVLEHETSVYRLVFDRDSEDVDLWTASGDGTAKCLSRHRAFASEDTFNHGDHVRAVALTDRWVITAGRDEDLKFWERASGKLYCSLQGHYDEVTDLAVLSSLPERVVSVSIDGTVRTWPLQTGDLDILVEEQKKEAVEEEEEQHDNKPEGLLTADEEAELAALMDDDD
jgi:WD40 repeat protein